MNDDIIILSVLMLTMAIMFTVERFTAVPILSEEQSIECLENYFEEQG